MAGPAEQFDPDQYRMTVGEHLEELRRRLIFALAGFAVIFAVLLIPTVGQHVISYFCRPLIELLHRQNLNPQLFYTGLGEPFVIYIQIATISAIAIASPWIAYQFWKFIAAGLYPDERRSVTKFVPISILLLIGGMLFVYFLVLPWTVEFFLTFGNNIPLPQFQSVVPPSDPPAGVTLPITPVLKADPITPQPGNFWFNKHESRLKFCVSQDDIRVIPFGPGKLLAPHITLPDYIWLVVGMLIMFGLSFQVPLVVMAVGRLGIVDVATLRSGRRYVYFAMVILAAVVTPGDVITATVALIVPLVLLYELGIWLAAVGPRTKTNGDDDDSSYRTPPISPSV